MVSLSLAMSAAVAGPVGVVGVVGVVVSAVDFGIGSGGLGGSCCAAGRTKVSDIINHSTSASAAAAITLSKPSMASAGVRIVPSLSFNIGGTQKFPS